MGLILLMGVMVRCLMLSTMQRTLVQWWRVLKPPLVVGMAANLTMPVKILLFTTLRWLYLTLDTLAVVSYVSVSRKCLLETLPRDVHPTDEKSTRVLPRLAVV